MMKKILVILFLLIGFSSHSQYTKHLLTSGSYPAGSGYPATNNVSIGFGVHIPPTNPNGKLPMCFVFLHGAGERGPAGDITTPSGVDKVATVSLPAMVKTTNIGRFVADGGGATDSLGVAVVFPQCANTFSTWPICYPAEMVKYVKANLANQVDTNRIVICGLSQGGGGTLGAAAYGYTIDNTAIFFSVCPGYFAYTNRQEVADSSVIYVYHAANDPTASVVNPDGMVSSTNTFIPVNGIQYFRFSGATPGFSGHNIWDEIFKTTPGTMAALSNGDTYVHKTLYSIAAGIRKQRYKRP